MDKIVIRICMGSSCFSRGNNKTVEILEDFIEKNKTNVPVDIQLFGSLCMDKCSKGPILIINDKVYEGVTPDSAIDLLRHYIKEAEKCQM